MMRALFSGVTGLRSHQTRMDVIGNNIANVNTVGFKKSNVTFKDLYSETISAAASATGAGAGTTGGVNPRQIGLGAQVNSISVVHTPGAAQYTGNGMDVAISGDGYFVVETPSGTMYTRAGNFYTDLQGNLVTSDGYYVQTVPPVQKAEMTYAFDKVIDATMRNDATGITAPAGGVIQEGKPTADLSTVGGKNFSFRFAVDTPPWTATVDASVAKLKGAAGTVSVEGTEWYKSNMEQAVQQAAEANNATAYAGNLSFGFAKTDVDNGDGTHTITLDLKAGNLSLGSVTLTALDDGTLVDNAVDKNPLTGPATLNFGPTTITATGNGTDPLTADGVYNALMNGAKGMPAVKLEENGTWQLMDGNTVIEDVVMSATMASGGGINGDFKITTTDYGTFTLKTTNIVSNMQALSTALANSTFSVDVNEAWGVVYESPGTVLEGNLNTLQIDFDKYSSLAIDPTGAVVAQLKQDTQIIVDGETVQLGAGSKVVLGYVALASFNNPSGLEKVADNLYSSSANSGEAVYSMPGTGSVGQLSPSNLEMSNVDLSEEIVNMITTQRGFQANSRIITTTDTMLEELVNLKR